MSEHQQLEQILRDLPRLGRQVKDRGYRQVWRFEFQGRAYYLKYYPRTKWDVRRWFRGSPALREFLRLQDLQRASIPAPRAVALLSGFRLAGGVGDAVILEAVEPAVTLDQYVNDLQLRGRPIPDHRGLSRQIRTLVHQLGQAKLGHNDLHLGNFLLKDGSLFLLDGYAVERGGLKLRHVLQLAHGVREVATRADLQRGWEQLGGGGRMPRRNPVGRRWWDKLVDRSTGENRYFGRLRAGAWLGHFYKEAKVPRRWSMASRLQVPEKEWQGVWAELLGQIEADVLEVIKRTASGDVLAGEVVLAGRPVPVIVKRPRRKYVHRYVTDVFRGTRCRRGWKKAWRLVARGIPTAWPLLLMERRTLGYVTDQVLVFERVPGPTLAEVELDALGADARQTLFHRAGRLLRLLEQTGLYQYDAKASNWIVRADEVLGPSPVLIDVDGIRPLHYGYDSVNRLLRSMREHPQYTPLDSLHLCRGYAPFARLSPE